MTNGSWVVCFACGLRHTARPTGDCPRCHAPSSAAPEEPSGSGWRPPTVTRTHPIVRPRRRHGFLLFLLALGAAGAAAVYLERTSPAFRRFFVRAVDTEGGALTHVQGPGWSFDVPPAAWYASPRKPWAADPRSPVLLERAFVRPDGPAVAYLLSARIPTDRGVDFDATADAVSREVAKAMTNYRVLDVAALPGRGGTRVLHVTGTLDGEDLEALCLLTANAPAFFELVVGAPPAVFAARRAELQAILESFHGEATPVAATPPAAAR